MLLAKRAGQRLGVADELNGIFSSSLFFGNCVPFCFNLFHFLRQGQQKHMRGEDMRRHLTLTLVLGASLGDTIVFSILTKVGAST